MNNSHETNSETEGAESTTSEPSNRQRLAKGSLLGAGALALIFSIAGDTRADGWDTPVAVDIGVSPVVLADIETKGNATIVYGIDQAGVVHMAGTTDQVINVQSVFDTPTATPVPDVQIPGEYVSDYEVCKSDTVFKISNISGQSDNLYRGKRDPSTGIITWEPNGLFPNYVTVTSVVCNKDGTQIFTTDDSSGALFPEVSRADIPLENQSFDWVNLPNCSNTQTGTWGLYVTPDSSKLVTSEKVGGKGKFYVQDYNQQAGDCVDGVGQPTPRTDLDSMPNNNLKNVLGANNMNIVGDPNSPIGGVFVNVDWNVSYAKDFNSGSGGAGGSGSGSGGNGEAGSGPGTTTSTGSNTTSSGTSNPGKCFVDVTQGSATEIAPCDGSSSTYHAKINASTEDVFLEWGSWDQAVSCNGGLLNQGEVKIETFGDGVRPVVTVQVGLNCGPSESPGTPYNQKIKFGYTQPDQPEFALGPGKGFFFGLTDSKGVMDFDQFSRPEQNRWIGVFAMTEGGTTVHQFDAQNPCNPKNLETCVQTVITDENGENTGNELAADDPADVDNPSAIPNSGKFDFTNLTVTTESYVPEPPEKGGGDDPGCDLGCAIGAEVSPEGTSKNTRSKIAGALGTLFTLAASALRKGTQAKKAT